jgi:hypothetical protein
LLSHSFTWGYSQDLARREQQTSRRERQIARVCSTAHKTMATTDS